MGRKLTTVDKEPWQPVGYVDEEHVFDFKLKSPQRLEDVYPGYTARLAPQMVEKPPHYTSHPSGIECIDVTKHMNFCLGNAIKYIWRADEKGDAVVDLRKAIKYLEFEIEKRSK